MVVATENVTAEDIERVPADLDLFEEIKRLKAARRALILAHYYQDPDIQDIADLVGDSLALARSAQKTEADVIVFAGVHFMAETAKILNPTRTVVVPDLDAGCSLADGCPPDAFAEFCRRYADHKVISYINCTAAVKALSDVICTSSNAETIVRSFPPETPLIFAPDRNLGRYLIKKIGRSMRLWDATCIVHEVFSEKKIVQLKHRHPEALVLAHPECEEPVLAHADYIASTAGMIRFAAESDAPAFIVATEPGILHAMAKAAPGKTLIHAPVNETCACRECPHMRLNTLEKIYLCLERLRPRIQLAPALARRALRPLERMLELSA